MWSLVVGCDGIKSRIRRVMLGDAHPASFCQYAHEICYRALVPLASLRPMLGSLASHTSLYLAPRAYLIVYPVGTGALANISVYVNDDDDDLRPPHGQSHGRSAPRAELAAVLGTLGPSLRALADILPENISAWALHDLHEHPLTTYAFGQVCVAGDAAHAATSHQVAGAGIGIEDVAVLCKLLARVSSAVRCNGGSRANTAEMVRTAVELYDGARRERSQWLVWSSRRQGQLMKYMVPDIGADMGKIEEDLTKRARMLLTWNMEAVIKQALQELDKRIAATEADV